ncbi:winged helix-turn-helix transcriptional regulator [Microbacterium kyungheense]|uniref:HxlR family transcriptional regulator n=1 Tax=Microbacterium kyungheense TaxID=1263636 RepID=A0A543F0L1_9MICO|nr:helix-turn-helix domain-containing protein [Microbacterium kyungheense]TQM27357.1 HxlR family transcriptional regulator [Microbacterium kyungheense]
MRSYGQYCALARGLDVVGDRWTLLIVRELLSLGPSRYADLQRGLPGIATNLLATRLREMESAGLVVRMQLPRPANVVVFALTPRGAALEGALRELVKWGAPTMSPPSAHEEFRAHWLQLPLRGLCRDNAPGSPPQVVRVGSLDDGCDIAVDGGSIEVAASTPTAEPAAVVDGDPGALVALFTGQLPIDAAASAGMISGDVEAVRRVVGGYPAGMPHLKEALP